MVLCGGKGERLYPLTSDRAKPSVPFLGVYRIIDFSLSERPQFRAAPDRPPHPVQVPLARAPYPERLEHLPLRERRFHHLASRPGPGQRPLVRGHGRRRVPEHLHHPAGESGDGPRPLGRPRLQVPITGRSSLFFGRSGTPTPSSWPRRSRSPRPPVSASSASTTSAASSSSWRSRRSRRPCRGTRTRTLISMGVYLFRTPVLIKALLKDARTPGSTHDFGKDIIPTLIRRASASSPTCSTTTGRTSGRSTPIGRPTWPFCRRPRPSRSWTRPGRSGAYKPQFPPTFVDRGDDPELDPRLRAARLSDCRVRQLHPRRRASGSREGADVADSILFEDVEVRPGRAPPQGHHRQALDDPRRLRDRLRRRAGRRELQDQPGRRSGSSPRGGTRE